MNGVSGIGLDVYASAATSYGKASAYAAIAAKDPNAGDIGKTASAALVTKELLRKLSPPTLGNNVDIKA